MSEAEVGWLAVLASYPIRHGYESGPPLASCSGTIISFGGHHLVLTVAHAVLPGEEWAVELDYDASAGARLWRLGQMQYISELSAAGLGDVDFAFTIVPKDLRGHWQSFSETGALGDRQERVILATDLTVAPQTGCRYAFGGLTRHTAEPQPPGYPYPISGAELRVETALVYRDTIDGMDRYQLGHAHPGGESYRGCSGAPVLSEEGDLVGLVIGGDASEATIHALALRRYRGAIAAYLASA